MNGIFILSLDFELFWGIRDKYSYEAYGKNVEAVWQVVPKLLSLFETNKIHATWATVGFLMCENKEELIANLPTYLPTYDDKNLSPYNGYIKNLTEIDSKFHFGKTLLNLVKEAKNQEIGTHTLSHYYAMEQSQTIAQFESDITTAIELAKKNHVTIESIIFPRHQINKNYFSILKKNGINIYRETEKIWYHSASVAKNEGIIKRSFRYFDYYIKLGSHHCQDISEIRNGDFFAIRASRWLRPYKPKLKYLDFLKIKRIKNQMSYAAKNNKIFHLWFHPHDIGINQQENFQYLEQIFSHYNYLNAKYNFESLNMVELVNRLK